MLISILKVVFMLLTLYVFLSEIVYGILLQEERIGVVLRVLLFIMLSLWVFFVGTKFNFTLPKFGFVFTIIIVIFLSLLTVFLLLLVVAFNYDLAFRESPRACGPPDFVPPDYASPSSSTIDDLAEEEIKSNIEIIERQRTIIRKNKRELREVRRQLKGTRAEMERIRLYGIKVRISNFAFSVITGIIGSILFHYISELLNWN